MTGAIAWAGFVPEILVVGAALLVFLLDSAGIRRLEAFGAVALAGLGLALLAVLADLGFAPLAVFRTIPASGVDPLFAPGALYAFTSFGLAFEGIFLAAAILVSLASLSRESYEKGAAVYFGLLLLATAGMLLVAISADLIFLLVAVEVVGLSTYLMVAYPRRDPRGLEAAMKFFIIGALSAALSFFGASLLYGAYGTTSLSILGRGLGTAGIPGLALAGYAFLLVGLSFKVTAVPFHMWAVDVYDGAPTDVAAFLAGGTKKIGLFAFFLVFLVPIVLAHGVPSPGPLGATLVCGPVGVGCALASSLGASLQVALGVLAVLTMTVGNVLALLQREMKRMLAYSSISQAGYMLIGIAVGTPPALAGATLQIFAHVFMKGGAFLVVAGLAGLGVGPLIEDWRGVGLKRPLVGAAFAVMLLSLAGIPLTVGFVAKFVLFSAAVQAKGWFVWLAVAGLLNSALSVFYYARVLKAMYLDRPEAATPAPRPGPREIAGGSTPERLALGGLGYGRAAAIFVATLVIFAFGVDPQPLLAAFQAGAQHFLAIGA
jgi:NADH:ubiquinone oxidoreductase subunit 2 (subunit N)